MSFLSKVFSSNAETGDNPKLPSLRTHQYRNDHQQLLDAIQKMPKEVNGFQLVNTNQSKSEINLIYRQLPFTHDVVLTLFRITPTRYAVDVYASSRARMGDFGRSHQIIAKVYQYLDSRLTRSES